VSCHGRRGQGRFKLRAPGDASASAWFWRTERPCRRGLWPWEVGKNFRPEPDRSGVSWRICHDDRFKVPAIRPGGVLPASGSKPLFDAAWMPFPMTYFPLVCVLVSVSHVPAWRLSGIVLPKRLTLNSRTPPLIPLAGNGWRRPNDLDARWIR
jgi:hypothetical protein